MPHLFDSGYNRKPFSTFAATYPGPDVYPPKDFRVEWGPIFHRGRLDGTARVLVIGQDPGSHESIARRILVVEALGGLADLAFQNWRSTPSGQGVEMAYRHIRHPTYPESASAAGQMKKSEAMKQLLSDWNDALKELRPKLHHPDVHTELVPYGTALDKTTDLAPIPDRDL